MSRFNSTLFACGNALQQAWLTTRRTTRSEDRAELEGVRRLADEDVTLLDEELQRPDAEVSAHPLDAEGRSDYQRALDAYESAQRSVPRMRGPDEISNVTDTLSTGRYALACVQARAAGRPLPEHRVPCFFNPARAISHRRVVHRRRSRDTLRSRMRSGRRPGRDWSDP